jgi:hypothetical protein
VCSDLSMSIVCTICMASQRSLPLHHTYALGRRISKYTRCHTHTHTLFHVRLLERYQTFFSSIWKECGYYFKPLAPSNSEVTIRTAQYQHIRNSLMRVMYEEVGNVVIGGRLKFLSLRCPF